MNISTLWAKIKNFFKKSYLLIVLPITLFIIRLFDRSSKKELKEEIKEQEKIIEETKKEIREDQKGIKKSEEKIEELSQQITEKTEEFLKNSGESTTLNKILPDLEK